MYGDHFLVMVMPSVISMTSFCVMVMRSVILNHKLWYHCWVINFVFFF